MKVRKCPLVLFVLLAMCAIGLIVVLTRSKYRPEVNTILGKLVNDRWEERASAVHDIIRSQQLINDDRVATALIDLLGKENQKDEMRGKGETLGAVSNGGEGYGEYVIDVVDAVGRLKSDRAMLVLVEAIEYGPGVAQALIKYGDKAVSPLLAKCRKGIELERWLCVRALPLFYSQTVSNEIKQNINDMLNYSAQKDESEFVRRSALEAMKECLR